MFFSIIQLRRDASPHDIVQLTSLNGYKTHQLVWSLFGDHPDRQRDFIYRHETTNGWPTFYVVSRREPLDHKGLWDIISKKYTPQLRGGQHLNFSLRVNPIRSRRDENGKQHRHDVIMEAKTNAKKTGVSFMLPDLIQKNGMQWLDERATLYGFSILPAAIRIDGYQQHKLFKGRGSKPISYSTVDINGILTVTDPALFVEKTLYQGVGPAKGFGCGLMMVKRA